MSKKGNLWSKRLAREISNLENNKIEGVEISPTEDILIWKGHINGPKNSPFEGGEFKLVINFTKNYPFKPPSVKFLEPEKIFHPNFYRDGKICIDILQSKWSAALSVQNLLLSIISLFMDPNPKSPANRQAAIMFSNDYNEYCKEVKKRLVK